MASTGTNLALMVVVFVCSVGLTLAVESEKHQDGERQRLATERMENACRPVLELTESTGEMDKGKKLELLKTCMDALVENNSLWKSMVNEDVELVHVPIAGMACYYGRVYWAHFGHVSARDMDKMVQGICGMLLVYSTSFSSLKEYSNRHNFIIERTCNHLVPLFAPYRPYFDGLRAISPNAKHIYRESIRDHHLYRVLAVDQFCRSFTKCEPGKMVPARRLSGELKRTTS